ncbi:site-2 protease family protein [Dictyobacter aurantiacus]|uniref:Peptidase n=1 Tax=Dictyobacter aurantiacus TaxID=1936993 RepID=A0A401ZCK6_9CHLR|nr:site-2 protease family protein [Dictyobacter aurantiacus]GCE04589.1 peptidase [Dictyobacter aurantiacus]
MHEWAHAQMASWLGDHSSGTLERKSWRLGSHIDPVGTLLCIILAFLSYAGLGWGRPVKPDPWKMKVGANTGVLLVACAGPIFSLIVGLAVAALTRLLIPVVGGNIALNFVMKLLTAFATVNVGLAILNIIPLYPLDGYQIVYTLLPSKQAVQFSRSAAYGPFILLIVFFFLPFIGQFVGMADILNLASDIRNISLFLTSQAAGASLVQYFVYPH